MLRAFNNAPVSIISAFLLGFLLSNILYVLENFNILSNQNKVHLKSKRVSSVQVQSDDDHGASAAIESVAVSNTYKPGAAICAIQKWALRYIDEWVDYHLALGFETIYIYDNSDDFELEHWLKGRRSTGGAGAGNETASAGRKLRIVVKHYPGIVKQIEAYNECGTSIRERKSHEWIAFIDLDEFVVIRDTKKYPHIMDLLLDAVAATTTRQDLNEKVNVGGLAMNWESFRFNNQTKYEPKPLTLRFQRKQLETSRHIKTIARASAYKQAADPHSVKFAGDDWKTIDSSGNIVDGSFNQNGPSDVISLFHYHTKSLEEVKERCKRGRADIAGKEHIPYCDEAYVQRLYDEDCALDTIMDDSAWKLLKKRVPKYSQFFDSNFDIGV